MTTNAWLDERESRAWRAMQNLRSPLEAAMNRQLSRDSGLSTADYAILVALSEAPAQRLRARDLVLLIGWEKSRLSHQIRRMESRGLVSRAGCPTDGRGAFITLTDSGRQVIVQAAPGHVAAVRRIVIDALTADQLDQLAAIAEAVTERLRAEGCAHADADDGDADDGPGVRGCDGRGAVGCESESELADDARVAGRVAAGTGGRSTH